MPANKKQLLVLLPLVFSINACMHTDDDEAPANELIGSWGGECQISEVTESEKFTITFTNAEYSFTSTRYGDTSCTASLITMDGSSKGTYKIGNEIILTSGETVKEIDFTFTQLIFAPKHQNVADYFNNNNQCGKNDWEVDVAADVSGCTDFVGSGTNYDIYKLKDGELFFGDENLDEGDTVENRISALEAEGMPKN